MARALLGLLWAVSHLPLALQALLGRAFGALLYVLARSRRRVALRNLELCFPQRDERWRRALAFEHFQWLGRSLLERGLLWYASPERLRRLIHVEGDVEFAQKTDDPVMDAAMRRGRLRFGGAEVFARSEKALPLVRAIHKKGYAFFNLPDMDFGQRDAAFIPFFGVSAATLLAPSKMASSLKMKVQPVIAEILPGGLGYRVRFLPAWTNWPSDDPLADARAMNQWIEHEVERNPAQYLWVHKRFKTRPPGEAAPY